MDWKTMLAYVTGSVNENLLLSSASLWADTVLIRNLRIGS
jgi:hypothetical protein